MIPQKILAEHLAGVAELEATTFSEPWSREALELLLSDRATGYCLTEGKTVVAYGSLLYAPDEGQILNLAVAPAYQRRGYAKAILSALEADAREHGALSLFLEVRESNLPAISLYKSFGFSLVGTRKNFYRAPTETALIFKKDLL
ncbi:MAG: ribosomal protein S18-alanine N-acetyltransferase [Clostridia bacterium]|nr:ribosomal protein S18-alanine N-acetyltransferase [Clostridia bacterium]